MNDSRNLESFCKLVTAANRPWDELATYLEEKNCVSMEAIDDLRQLHEAIKSFKEECDGAENKKMARQDEIYG